ncbi:unnamed protein product [Effrenium voratum]|nr:unnamed protein product [Effrenium voratum]
MVVGIGERLREAEGIAAAFVVSITYTALLASNKQLHSLHWPYLLITGSSALLVGLCNVTRLWCHGLLRLKPSDVKWVMARGGLGSTSNCLGVFAVLAGAHVGSCAALRSVNSIVASLGTVAMGEHFGWMHLLSVTLFVVGAVLAADPEQAVASVGSNLLGSCLALASGVCSFTRGSFAGRCASSPECPAEVCEAWKVRIFKACCCCLACRRSCILIRSLAPSHLRNVQLQCPPQSSLLRTCCWVMAWTMCCTSIC